MMNSPAMIATTEPKLAADNTVASGNVRSNHSKRDIRETETSGNSFSKTLKLAEEQRDSAGKESVSGKLRDASNHKARGGKRLSTGLKSMYRSSRKRL